MAQDATSLAREEVSKGIQRHRNGDLSLARSHYQRAAKMDPTNADAWHLLGVIALESAALPLAVKQFTTCLKQQPNHAEALNNLGVALRRLDRHREALAAFRKALAARDRYVEAAHNIGLTLESIGDLSGAEQAYRHALLWRANYADAAIDLGNLLRRLGRFGEALPPLQLALRIVPDSARAQGGVATVLSDLGRNEEALRHARAAIAQQPTAASWWRVLGTIQRLQHQQEAAIASLRHALELEAGDNEAMLELALVLAECGEIDESRALFAKARAPAGFAERLRWTVALSLPALYRDDAQIDAERERFARELERLHANLRLERDEDVVEAYNAVSGTTPFHLHYQPRDNTQLQYRFGDLVARVMSRAMPDLAQSCDWQPRTHGGRLRVGFVSSHLMRHSVSRYFTALIGGLDPREFDVRVWHHGGQRDASTEFIAGRVGEFVHVDEDVLSLGRTLRAARLDVLVYPEIGMDPSHQVLGGLRLAPVQCLLYGHPVTSGLPAIDWFISGAALEPEDARHHYRERLALLPGIGTRPLPPPVPGDGSLIDAYTSGSPLLLCLQNQIKLMPDFDRVLARIAADSGARIGFFMRNAPLVQRFRARVESAFAAAGADPQRQLIFMPARQHADYLAGIARAALVLDSPWFSGGATSLDAFSVGIPVLAWEGPMARGRQTSGMLRMMGVDELIASTERDYVTKAIALCADEPQRAALRERILANKRRLFDDESAVVAFAEFLRSAAIPA